MVALRPRPSPNVVVVNELSSNNCDSCVRFSGVASFVLVQLVWNELENSVSVKARINPPCLANFLFRNSKNAFFAERSIVDT